MKFEQLQKDMIAAMKARDKARKDSISSLISAVKKAAIDEGTRDNISDELADRVILKELKTAEEQIASCPAERTELKAEYEARAAVIREYMPKLMSAEEVRETLETRYADVLATKNKGMIMKTVMAELKGKADGKVINQVVAELTK
ncbi:MAG: GatB/YqeY domain-containing protein [Lachnospiraceae bacterium]|nr:GatB/YqeY domain-containing protein [Lachnospiraceae bacterium]